MLPNPAVQKVVIDFESAIWGALRKVLPTVKIMGCVFHWTQALWRNIQALGLQSAYTSDYGTFKFLRRVMALPFLPHDQIDDVFDILQEKATTVPLQEFMAYSMSKLHGLTAMFGHLPAGVSTKRLCAPTTMWKAGITVSTGERLADVRCHSIC